MKGVEHRPTYMHSMLGSNYLKTLQLMTISSHCLGGAIVNGTGEGHIYFKAVIVMTLLKSFRITYSSTEAGSTNNNKNNR